MVDSKELGEGAGVGVDALSSEDGIAEALMPAGEKPRCTVDARLSSPDNCAQQVTYGSLRLLGRIEVERAVNDCASVFPLANGRDAQEERSSKPL